MRHASGMPRLLWIAVKLFDKSVDKATWLETMENLGKEFEVHFLTSWRDRPPAISVCGRPIRYFPQYGIGPVRKATRRLLMRREARRQIAKVSPDIVLLNCTSNRRMLHTVVNACRHEGAKVVLDVRTLPTTDQKDHAWTVFGKSLVFASRHFDGVTYITGEMRRYCIERHHLPGHPSAVWTSGVNPDLFQSGNGCPNGGVFRLLYHGGCISASRGLGCLIQALDRIRDLDVRLTLLSSLRERAAVEWIDRLAIPDRVTLMDTIPYPQVPEEIHRCHAGILPFPACDVWNTSSPIKLFEYAACGKPVIVTDIPAHRNILKDQPFAFFASDASPEALAVAIRKAHAVRDRFPILGQAARQWVLAEHTWACQARRLGAFLKQVLES